MYSIYLINLSDGQGLQLQTSTPATFIPDSNLLSHHHHHNQTSSFQRPDQFGFNNNNHTMVNFNSHPHPHHQHHVPIMNPLDHQLIKSADLARADPLLKPQLQKSLSYYDAGNKNANYDPSFLTFGNKGLNEKLHFSGVGCNFYLLNTINIKL
jgi:hypothetical protein